MLDPAFWEEDDDCREHAVAASPLAISAHAVGASRAPVAAAAVQPQPSPSGAPVAIGQDAILAHQVPRQAEPQPPVQHGHGQACQQPVGVGATLLQQHTVPQHDLGAPGAGLPQHGIQAPAGAPEQAAAPDAIASHQTRKQAQEYAAQIRRREAAAAFLVAACPVWYSQDAERFQAHLASRGMLAQLPVGVDIATEARNTVLDAVKGAVQHTLNQALLQWMETFHVLPAGIVLATVYAEQGEFWEQHRQHAPEGVARAVAEVMARYEAVSGAAELKALLGQLAVEDAVVVVADGYGRCAGLS